MDSIRSRYSGLPISKVLRIIAAVLLSIIIVSAFTGAAVAKYIFYITDGQEKIVVYTYETDPEEILKQENVILGQYDEYIFSGIEDREASIDILRAHKVTVTADGEAHTVYKTKGTVQDVLDELAITVNDDDLINCSVSAKITGDMDIAVNRVTYNTVTKETAIPFGVTEIPTQTLKVGRRSTLSNGTDGVKTTTIHQTLIDGIVSEEVVASEEVTQSPINSQVLVGSVSAPTSRYQTPDWLKLDSNGNPVNYKAKYTGKATAYSALGKRTKLKPGDVAMDLSRFPKGTRLYIKTPDGSFTYGYSQVKDTGTAVSNGTVLVDLFFDSYKESCLFGAKQVEVYVF